MDPFPAPGQKQSSKMANDYDFAGYQRGSCAQALEGGLSLLICVLGQNLLLSFWKTFHVLFCVGVDDEGFIAS